MPPGSNDWLPEPDPEYEPAKYGYAPRPARWVRGFKLRTVLLPFSVVAGNFLIGYTALHWFALLLLGPGVLPATLTQFVLPLCLPWLPILFWLRHRIKLLIWPNDEFTGYVVACLLISIPTITAQHFIETAMGDLTVIKQVSQIGRSPLTQYYIVEDMIVDKAQARADGRNWTSGRHSTNWNMALYYVIPLRSPAEQISTGQPAAWLGVQYGHTINNNSLSIEEKNTLWKSFAGESDRKLAKDDFRWINYLSLAGNDKDRNGFIAAVRSRPMSSREEIAPILLPHAGSITERSGSTLAWTAGTFIGGQFVWLLFVLGLRVHPARVRPWRAGERPDNRGLLRWLALLVPQKIFWAAPILFDLNLLVWLAMLVAGIGIDGTTATELIAWGGAFAPLVHEGEVWRLGTAIFVHSGLVHISNNLMALGLLGFFAERLIGSRWFATIYLVTGIVGEYVSLLTNANRVSVGASGAIFGLAGFALVVVLLEKKIDAASKPLLLKVTTLYLGLNLLLGAFLPGVDFAAHLGGLICGVVLGGLQVAVSKQRKSR